LIHQFQFDPGGVGVELPVNFSKTIVPKIRDSKKQNAYMLWIVNMVRGDEPAVCHRLGAKQYEGNSLKLWNFSVFF
jgi:hypothetical protein